MLTDANYATSAWFEIRGIPSPPCRTGVGFKGLLLSERCADDRCEGDLGRGMNNGEGPPTASPAVVRVVNNDHAKSLAVDPVSGSLGRCQLGKPRTNTPIFRTRFEHDSKRELRPKRHRRPVTAWSRGCRRAWGFHSQCGVQGWSSWGGGDHADITKPQADI